MIRQNGMDNRRKAARSKHYKDDRSMDDVKGLLIRSKLGVDSYLQKDAFVPSMFGSNTAQNVMLPQIAVRVIYTIASSLWSYNPK